MTEVEYLEAIKKAKEEAKQELIDDLSNYAQSTHNGRVVETVYNAIYHATKGKQ